MNPPGSRSAAFENPNKTFLIRKAKRTFCSLPLVGVETGGGITKLAPNWHGCKTAGEEE